MVSRMRENIKRRSSALLVAIVAVLATSLVVETTPAAQSANYAVTGRWAGSVNTGSLAAVNAAYWSRYAAMQNRPIGWTGSVSGCYAGYTPASANAATLSALNYVRSLAGLAPVTFSSTLNYYAQRTALMMAANRTLSHYPSSGWRCYSSTGATTASRSNLALAYPALGAGQIVDLYMDDRGSSNTAVGHRRWILNPFSTAMGSGSTTTSNALQVIGPSSASRPNPAYVGWPTAGYFPNALEPGGRWSLSAGSKRVSFARSVVRVWWNGHAIPVRKYGVQNGYAQPTLVWQMPSTFPKTGTYRVTVSKIKYKGKRKKRTYTYYVRMFTPYH